MRQPLPEAARQSAWQQLWKLLLAPPEHDTTPPDPATNHAGDVESAEPTEAGA